MESKKTKGFFLVKNGPSTSAFESKSFPLRALKNDEVLIDSEAFGLNFADVMARKGLYREAPPLPCILGYELVGVIQEIGSDVPQSFIGKRVLAFSRFGGYARHVITSFNAVAIIGDAPFHEIMALGTQGATAYYMAQHMINLHQGERVLIHAAAGGVGSLLIQLAKRNGAIVYAKIGNEEKQEVVKSLGADFVIVNKSNNYDDQLRQLLKNEKLDVIFNPSSGSTYKKDLALLGAGGKLILFGAAELASAKWGIFSKLNFIRKMGFSPPIGLMMTSKSVLGVNMLKIADDKPEVLAKCMTEMIKKYELKEITSNKFQVFNETELAEAHDLLASGKSTGKLIIQWDK